MSRRSRTAYFIVVIPYDVAALFLRNNGQIKLEDVTYTTAVCTTAVVPGITHVIWIVGSQFVTTDLHAVKPATKTIMVSTDPGSFDE